MILLQTVNLNVVSTQKLFSFHKIECFISETKNRKVSSFIT